MAPSDTSDFGNLRFVPLLLLLLCFASCQDSATRTFLVRGVVQEIKPDGTTAVIKHEAIPGYMDAMTMPFDAKTTNELASVARGDEVRFQLVVTPDDSWIESVTRTGRKFAVSNAVTSVNTNASIAPRHPLMDYPFTNQLGQPVTLSSFRGQALAITFFFTRCPIPEYCPRLSKNFEEACGELKAMPNAPTNWHLLSVTIDPEFDSPAALRMYAKRYDHDPKRWSFLTGPKDKIMALARESGMTMEPDRGLLTHNFRTLIVDPAGKLQMNFPISGDISDGIVSELLKVAKSDRADPEKREL
ncbi:MAG TPA: SCO family protein [Lacipirellulaceae bacterium]|nr:SCO family protein [Lacipirellulaceae bacterium]